MSLNLKTVKQVEGIDTIDHSFDITDFGNRWRKFKLEASLVYMGRTENQKGFLWRSASGNAIFITQNNPETGEYGPGTELRPLQIGFASYIRITGTEMEVLRLRQLVRMHGQLVRMHAPSIKGESVSVRRYI